MAAYTTNEDLVPVYVQDAATLPDDMTALHEAAYTQIRKDLAAQGWETEDLDALTDETTAALKDPSCRWVLFLLFSGQAQHGRDESLLVLAEKQLGWYRTSLASTPIETTLGEDDDPPSTSGGYVVLG